MYSLLVLLMLCNGILVYPTFKNENVPISDYTVSLKYFPESNHPSLKAYARLPSPDKLMREYFDYIKRRTDLRRKEIEEEKIKDIYRKYLTYSSRSILNDLLTMRYL